MDDVDRKFLACVQEDATLLLANIAKRVGGVFRESAACDTFYQRLIGTMDLSDASSNFAT